MTHPVCPRLALSLFAALLAACLLAGPAGAREGRGADFDYLTLVLSWSPTYCESDAGRNDRGQCAPGRGYAFVVHGLWPQYEEGWPEYCETGRDRNSGRDGRWVPDATIRAMLDIMPSKRLVIHEWRKHGTCSGLGQRGYFAATRALFERIRIPERYRAPRGMVSTSPRGLVADFLAANDWLEPDMISLHCGNRRDTGRLDDLRICFTRDLQPRACGANERRGCRAEKLLLPPVRLR